MDETSVVACPVCGRGVPVRVNTAIGGRRFVASWSDHTSCANERAAAWLDDLTAVLNGG